jgi:hypothetical protein
MCGVSVQMGRQFEEIGPPANRILELRCQRSLTSASGLSAGVTGIRDIQTGGASRRECFLQLFYLGPGAG